jgi:hypothetical protein
MYEKFVREEEYEFQLFLFLRIPAKSAVNVHKVYVDKILSFILESSRGISLFSYQPKCKIAQIHARRA